MAAIHLYPLGAPGSVPSPLQNQITALANERQLFAAQAMRPGEMFLHNTGSQTMSHDSCMTASLTEEEAATFTGWIEASLKARSGDFTFREMRVTDRATGLMILLAYRGRGRLIARTIDYPASDDARQVTRLPDRAALRLTQALHAFRHDHPESFAPWRDLMTLMASQPAGSVTKELPAEIRAALATPARNDSDTITAVPESTYILG